MSRMLMIDAPSASAYAVMTALAYACGLSVAVTLGLLDRRRPRDLVEGSVVLVISCLLGGKLFHLIFEARGHPLPDGARAGGMADLLRSDPWHWVRLFEPGFVFYGGLVVAAVVMTVFARARGLDRIGDGFDCAAPGLAVGMAMGRLACFVEGCCHGRPTDGGWGVVYEIGHTANGPPLHPVQLYESAFWLAALVLMACLYRRRRFGGEVFLALCAAYAPARIIFEGLRGDTSRGLWMEGAVSTSQLVSVAVVGMAATLWVHTRRRAVVLRTACSDTLCPPAAVRQPTRAIRFRRTSQCDLPTAWHS